MKNRADEATASAVPRSRTALVTFLGSIVRPMGNWMPISATVDLMTQLGLDAPSVRTAVFRLKKRGWLVSETRDGVRGYSLTEEALAALAAGDEIIWHARKAADLNDGWCVVTFSVPESARSKRYQLTAHLSSLGFGNASTAMWLAPARMQSAAERAIDELDLSSSCAVFVGAYVAGQDLVSLVRRSWDLDSINDHYRGFIDKFELRAAELDATKTIDDREAFSTYVEIIDVWRKLPYRDPGLPAELLPRGWSAPAAAALFERIVTPLESRALAHAARHWLGNPRS